jgi:prephenate dehydrogenase
LALQLLRPEWNLRLWARSQRSAENAGKFFSSVSCNAAKTASGSDICVLCTPIGAMPDLAKQLAPTLSSATTVTDVGSVKGGVVNQLEAILGSRFVGSHPMAGSEQSGINAARANLFEGAVCIITPTEKSAPEKVQTLRELWTCVGCRIVEMSPREHDERVGCVSHLPHAIAATLVNAISLRVPDVAQIAGGGYRDTTRIAAGPSAMWREILLENRAALLAGLEDFSAMLDTMKEFIQNADSAELELFLERARAIRQDLP